MDTKSVMLVNDETAWSDLKAASADTIVMDLIASLPNDRTTDGLGLTALSIVRLAACIGVSETATRMALSRLAARGLLVRGNGRYEPSPKLEPLQTRLSGWRTGFSRIVDWQGDWFWLNATQPKLALKHRTRLARRCHWLGFVQVPHLGWIRPNNVRSLQIEVDAVFADIEGSTGLRSAILSTHDAQWTADLVKMWPREDINRFYADSTQWLYDHSNGLIRMADRDAMITSFAVGRWVVRRLAIDPLLPEAMIDVHKRDALINAMAAFADKSMTSWHRIMEQPASD